MPPYGPQITRNSLTLPRSPYRLFGSLSPFKPGDEDLILLAETGFPFSEGESTSSLLFDNANLLNLRQLIQHDLTYDTTPDWLDRDEREEAWADPVPRFALETLYGGGPDSSPMLYQEDGVRLRVGQGENGTADRQSQDGLPCDRDGKPLLADPRNAASPGLARLLRAFLTFHNRVVEELMAHDVPKKDLFSWAQREVRWHYQWLILHEFLPRVVGQPLLESLCLEFTDRNAPASDRWNRKPLFRCNLRSLENKRPRLPVEFSAAAFCFGPDAVPSSGSASLSYSGDPFAMDAAEILLRGKALGLPTGQEVAQAMLIPNHQILSMDNPHCPFTLDSARSAAKDNSAPFSESPSLLMETFGNTTPLWAYILKESTWLGKGACLGPAGGRIVAKVFLDLLADDSLAFVSMAPYWQPRRGRFGCHTDGHFTLSELQNHLPW